MQRLFTLSKAPYLIYNQFVLALKTHEPQIQTDAKEEKSNQLDHNYAFFRQHGKSRGRGRSFSSKGRWFQQRRFLHTAPIPTKQGSTQGHFSYKNHENLSAQQQDNNLFKQNNGVTCQIYGKLNHSALECWKRFDHAYQSEDIPQALTALTLNDQTDPNMYADSGATTHIVNDPGKISYKTPYEMEKD